MALTAIELQALEQLKSACKKYNNQRNEIDWEQRQWEIYRDYVIKWRPSEIKQFSDEAFRAAKFAVETYRKLQSEAQ